MMLPGNVRAEDCAQKLFALNNAAVGAGATAVITVAPTITMCPTRILVVTTGTAGFTLTNFTINNAPQWVIGQVYHSAIFDPQGDENTEFVGDCFSLGSSVSVSVTNLDGANARGIYITLKGPGY